MIVAFWNDLDDLYHHATFGEDVKIWCFYICHTAGLPARSSFEGTHFEQVLCRCFYVDGDDLTGVLHTFGLWLSPLPPPSSFAASESRIVDILVSQYQNVIRTGLSRLCPGEPIPEMSPFWILLLELRTTELVSGDSFC